jgi:hypothetical protein
VLVAAGAIALVAYLLTRSSKGDAAQTSEE